MKYQAESINPDRSKWGPLQIAAGYFLFGALWILFSDKLAAKIAINADMLSQISIYKGWGYVLVTAILLYWLISRYAKSIQDANERYKLIAENSSDVIWLYNPIQNKLNYISPSVLRLRGYTAEEVLSQPLSASFPSDDFEHLNKLTRERLSLFQAKGLGTVSYMDEISYLHRDGSIVSTEATSTYFFNNQNEVEIIGVTRDISRRKQAEMKLRESEKRFQDLVDQASDGIFVADTTGRYTLVNEEACRLVMYSKDELLTMNMRDLVAPEELEETPLRIDDLRSGQTLRSQRQLVRKDDSRIICEISSKMLPDGSYQSIVRDITERKVTEEALVRSEKRFHSLFENMVNGYARCQMLYDEQGKPNDFIYLDVNNAFKKILGLKDVLGRRVSELIPDIQTSNPEVMEIYGRVATTGHSEQFEAYVPGLGSGMWFSVSAYSFEKGFFVALFETISERKQAEEILQQSYRQLLSFIEQAPLSVAMFDHNMNYLAVSHRWIHDYGRGYTDLVGRNHYEVNPDISDTWKEAHQKGLEGEAIRNDDDLWVQEDGRKNWLKWAIAPWKDEHGAIGGIIISAEDISERKRAEANAFKSEMRYHRILDAMMEGCQIIDFDWKYVYVNNVVAQQGKHTPQELLNHTILEIYPDIEQTDLFDALRRCMDDREAKRMENPFVFPDGGIGWFELSIQPAEEGIFILSTDITERKLAEKQVEESERRYRELVQNTNSAILRWKHDGTITFFNEYAQAFFGYNPEEIIGRDVNILVPPTESTGGDLSKLVENILEHPEQFINVVNENICRDGRRVWMTWTNKPTYDENGNVSEILAVGVDITERKRAEDALRQSQEDFARAFNSNPAALAITHIKDGKFLIVNESYIDVMGYQPEEVLGHSVAELNIYANPEDRNQLISQLREHGMVRNHELLVHSKSGEYKSLMVSMEPILYDKEESILSTFIDITEKKRVEEELRQLNEDLEARVIERTSQLAAANKELESFSYSVSHDLRAPLRAIDGYSNILLEDYEPFLDEEGKRVCGIISRETKRMGRLIDDLLSFSRMGRREVRFQKIEMKAMVDSAFEELLKDADRSRIDIRVGDLHAVTGDTALMRQVWINLLSNAIKFSSKKTRAIIEVDSTESEEGIVYLVHDNGAGFEMEYANKLFGVFQRLHGESEFEGTGVGLAIVQRVIHRHGGRIWAESKVNEGTTFRFVLPQRND